MRAVDGRFQPNREVDDIRWLPLDGARRLLTYDRDRAILDRFTGGDAPGD
jgi:8-oxo-dGTP diphosphatase